MASMEDLISTLAGGADIGNQGQKLRDLHDQLASTLHPNPTYRPIPPPQPDPLSPSQGPLPPPAPASSWNDPAPPSSFGSAAASAWLSNSGSSPRQGPATGFVGKRETGFSVPPPKNDQGQNPGQGTGTGMPYHAAVLPVRASPKDTGGFEGDAFKPLWEGRSGGAGGAQGSSGNSGGGGAGGGRNTEERSGWNGFKAKPGR